MSSLRVPVCIIGGGAAGFWTAITCAGSQAAHAQPIGVLVLEKSKDVLHKVRISGGGRCNVTHGFGTLPQEAYPRGAELLARLQRRFGPSDTVRWFQEEAGVPLKTERDGRVFPVSNDSRSIVDSLRAAARGLDVDVRTNEKVVAATRKWREVGSIRKPYFHLEVEGKTVSNVECDRVVFCCGSMHKRSVQRLLEGVGLELRPTAPSLFSFLLEDPASSGLEGLEGLSVPDAEVSVSSLHGQSIITAEEPGKGGSSSSSSLNARTQRGPILITHAGLSGPAILKLSAWGAYSFQSCDYRANLRINWAPYLDGPDQLFEALQARSHGNRKALRGKSLAEASPLPALPARLWGRVLQRVSGLINRSGSRWDNLVDSDGNSFTHGQGGGVRVTVAEQPWREFEVPGRARALADAVWPHLTSFDVAVAGRRPNKEEFVTAGGVNWREGMDWNAMESISCPGAHFAGEVLDVDGVTGGFNFQGCWTTGHVAGLAVARSLAEE